MNNLLKVDWAKHNLTPKQISENLNIPLRVLLYLDKYIEELSAIDALRIAKFAGKEVEEIFILEEEPILV